MGFLGDAGYVYVNIDDTSEGQRDAQGQKYDVEIPANSVLLLRVRR